MDWVLGIYFNSRFNNACLSLRLCPKVTTTKEADCVHDASARKFFPLVFGVYFRRANHRCSCNFSGRPRDLPIPTAFAS